MENKALLSNPPALGYGDVEGSNITIELSLHSNNTETRQFAELGVVKQLLSMQLLASLTRRNRGVS